MTRDQEMEKFWQPYARFRQSVELAPEYQDTLKRGDYDRAQAVALDYIHSRQPANRRGSKADKRHRAARADFMEDMELAKLVGLLD